MTTSIPLKEDRCKACGVYEPRWNSWYSDTKIPVPSRALASIEDGKKAGCPCCHIIVDALNAMDGEWLANKRQSLFALYWLTDTISLQFRDDTSDVLDIFCHVDGIRKPDGQDQRHIALCGAHFATRSEVVAHAMSDAAFSRARSWLEDCVHNHPNCAVPFFSTAAPETAYMPTRVLDVGHTDTIILVENATAAPYVALSYCWGPDLSGVVTTTTANAAAHRQQGMALVTLPQTIRDAVLVTRKLDVQYLWVDALCIVQDDSDDWRREAAQMCSVYQGSHVTLAAHRAAACQLGFLQPHVLGQLPYQRVFWTDATDSDGHSSSSPPTKMLLRLEHRSHYRLPSPPLDTRAWTLQEALLPPRVLHFFDLEMAWECQTTDRCECGGRVHFVHPHLPLLGRSLRADEQSHAPEGEAGERDAVAERSSWLAGRRWMSLVRTYSQRSLTRLSDKLVAMDGLARMVEQATGTAMSPSAAPLSRDHTIVRPAYVEGLFRAHFAQQLLWGVDVPIQPADAKKPPLPTHRRSSAQLRAPSWSWASVDAPVGYPTGDLDQTESVIRVHGFVPCCNGQRSNSSSTVSTVTGLQLTALAVPAALRTMSWTGVDRSPVVVSSPCIVRARNGWAHGVYCDDVRAPDLALDDTALPCWVGDGTSSDRRLRQLWQTTRGSGTDDALSRGCQHRRSRQRRQYSEDDVDETPRWCSTCRPWPDGDPAAWQAAEAGQTSPAGTACLLVQILTERQAGSHMLRFLVLVRSQGVPGAWERAGFGRYVKWDRDPAHLDLFWGGTIKDLLVV